MSEEHSISLEPGTVIGGKYEVVKCLGSGSMGLVYACRHRDLQEIVAVKVLFPEVAEDKVASARFKNEIRASYKVSHPNVVRAYDYITDRDLVAYSMEFVGGGDLAERLDAKERIPIPEILRLLSQMAAGCQAIHEAEIVHRDLKPENILLTDEGNVKIADFGIARNRHGPKLTEHGGVVGTIDYVAPEYMLKSQVDWRSDIYALGILAYEMVTGASPFKGDSVYATMTKRLKTDPSPPSSLRPECPAGLDRIILKAMQREPESRYQSSHEMFVDLQALCAQLGMSPVESGAVLRTASPSPSSGGKGATLIVETESVTGPKPAKRDGNIAQASRPPEVFHEEPRTRGDGRSSSESGGLAGIVMASQDPPTIELPHSRRKRTAGLEDTEVFDSASGARPVAPVDGGDAPFRGSEPLVSSSDTGVSARDAAKSQKKNVGVRPVRDRGPLTASKHAAGGRSYTGELIALGFAAAVGIGCGFMFVRYFLFKG